MKAPAKKKQAPEKAPAKMGRPSLYSEAVALAICEHIATGNSLVSFCKKEENPGYSTITRWLEKHDDFRANYVRARELQADYLAEEIVQIANTPVLGVKTKTNDKGEVEITEGDMIEHRRLQIDARKWYASKVAPKKYGDKLQVDQTTRFENLPDEAIAARLAAIQKQIADGQEAAGEARSE